MIYNSENGIACLIELLVEMEFRADRTSVEKFLAKFKETVAADRELHVPFRHENNRALRDLGINAKMRMNIILELSPEDYSSGPQPDKNRPGYVWVFGKSIGEREVYIKLKIAHPGSRKIAKCISFHEATTPLTYPFR